MVCEILAPTSPLPFPIEIKFPRVRNFVSGFSHEREQLFVSDKTAILFTHDDLCCWYLTALTGLRGINSPPAKTGVDLTASVVPSHVAVVGEVKPNQEQMLKYFLNPWLRGAVFA